MITKVTQQLSCDVDLFGLMLKNCRYNFDHPHSVKNVHKTLKENVSRMKNIITRRKIELNIHENYIHVLNAIKPGTFWVVNITSEDELKTLIKTRKQMIATFKRKIKSMESRLKSLEFLLQMLPAPKSH